MIRITLIKPLPLISFCKTNGSYCIGIETDQYAFQKEAGIRMNIACQPIPAAAFEVRPAVSRAYKYDTKGLSGPPK